MHEKDAALPLPEAQKQLIETAQAETAAAVETAGSPEGAPQETNVARSAVGRWKKASALMFIETGGEGVLLDPEHNWRFDLTERDYVALIDRALEYRKTDFAACLALRMPACVTEKIVAKHSRLSGFPNVRAAVFVSLGDVAGAAKEVAAMLDKRDQFSAQSLLEALGVRDLEFFSQVFDALPAGSANADGGDTEGDENRAHVNLLEIASALCAGSKRAAYDLCKRRRPFDQLTASQRARIVIGRHLVVFESLVQEQGCFDGLDTSVVDKLVEKKACDVVYKNIKRFRADQREAILVSLVEKGFGKELIYFEAGRMCVKRRFREYADAILQAQVGYQKKNPDVPLNSAPKKK